MASLFRDFLVALGEEGVDAVVCGGVACILHGVRRVTADLDLSVPFDAMSPAQRLDWIWARAVDLQWAASVREANPPAGQGGKARG